MIVLGIHEGYRDGSGGDGENEGSAWDRTLYDSGRLESDQPQARLRRGLDSLRLLTGAIPNTGFEPKSCIDVSSEHAPIKYTSRRNSFNIDYNDLTTTVAASETFDGFHKQAAASGSLQPVPANKVNPWLSADMWSRTGKLVRGGASNVSVEGTLSRGKRDQDLESVQTLSERKNLHVFSEHRGMRS